MSSLRLSLRLPASATAPGAARHALEGLELYVGDDVCETIQLLVSELVTNSLRHGGLEANDSIEVVVSARDEGVVVEVADPGPGFDLGDTELRRPGEVEASGWGLLLTNELAERWGVSAEGRTKVWFEIRPDGLRATPERPRRVSLDDLDDPESTATGRDQAAREKDRRRTEQNIEKNRLL